jgi:hypothetical protein
MENKNTAKNGQSANRHFPKEDIKNGQQIHEKVLSITNCQREGNQNHNEQYHSTAVGIATIQKSTDKR